MNRQIDSEAEMLKIIEDARETYANDVTDHTENEYIREGLLNANYRKTADVQREIIEEIDDALHDMAIEYEKAGHPEYFAVCEMVHHKVIRPMEKKYESEGANDE